MSWRMLAQGAIASLSLGLLLIAALSWPQLVAAQKDEPEELPSFPQPLGIGMKKFKIISEVVDEQDTMSRTYEEYVDLTLGLASFVANSKAGNSVRHVTADEGLVFSYAPYKCRVEDMNLAGDGAGGVGPLDRLGADVIVSLAEESEADGLSEFVPSGKYADRLPRATKSRPLRLFGVSGLWLMAASRPKSYKKANLIYSSTTDAYKPASVWHFEESGLGIDMFFSRDAGDSLDPSLEMIRISSIKERKVLRSINILAIERSIAPEAYDDILSVPLGYGCFSALSQEPAEPDAGGATASAPERAKIRRAYANRHRVDSDAVWLGRAELEVTATVNKAQSGAKRPSSDTFTVELAQTRIGNGGPASGPRVKLIRKRNTREDTKLVLNRVFRMKYKVDMLTGDCDMSHYSESDAVREQVLLDFANGAKFDANMELFKESDDLHFIKVTSSESNKRRLHHYEGTAASSELIHWIRSSTGVTEEVARRTRVVRSYSLGELSLELVSMTIWLLDEQETEIEESYQIYVVDMWDELEGELAETRAKLFDISYECYLENSRMLQNRDFAWFQLTYPVSQRVLQLVAQNAAAIKQLYYEHFVDDITRMPRVELVLEEDQFKLRTLLLDLPPVELAYDKLAGLKLVAAMEKHDQVNLEPDLRHCASLCRQQHCTIMTYCTKSKSCTLSRRQLHDFRRELEEPQNGTDSSQERHFIVDGSGDFAELRDEFGFAPEKDCDTYKITAQLERQQWHRVTNLASILAKLQHNNYNLQLELPEAPEAVTLSESESGLSEEERRQAMLDYDQKVYDLLANENRLPELSFPVRLQAQFFFLLPSKFELERDPLDDFQLHKSQLEEDADNTNQFDDDQKVPHFHKGLNQARLNAIGSKQEQVSFHSFRGLNYDQCAMACWDGKCGTFSFCESGGECILSSAKTIGHARALGLVVDGHDCLIAQRDFLGNFLKFANVYKPQVYKLQSRRPVSEPSECALDCVAETNFRCLAFQYCADADGHGQCFFQAGHHAANELAPNETGCDHYARSQLADYVRLDARRLTEDIAGKLKTNSYNDLTVFDCADKCSTELIDCTAFQFCHHPESFYPAEGQKVVPARECLTIESKVTRAMLKASNKSDEPALVDESSDDGQIVHSADFLTYDTDCQVFSMRRESTQAHLRDLALGGLITISTNADGSKPTDTTTGSGFGFWHAILVFASVAAGTTLLTCGLILLTRHNKPLRNLLARLHLINY